MKRFKTTLKGFVFVTLFLLLFAIPLYALNFQTASLDDTRISGDDRYKTAQAIALKINAGTVDCVVLAPGSSLANALPASVLAHKNKAPLLLANSAAETSTEAFAYIKSYLSKSGKIYLVGDSDHIGEDFITRLDSLGYKNVSRIAGDDKYQTAYLIANELNIPDRRPVVISSGESLADAVTISGFAAANGWPLLFTNGDVLTDNIRDYIAEKQPEEIYITGGDGAVSSTLETELKNLVPNTRITRFAGADRYDTAISIARNFAPNPRNIYIISGIDYLDAAAGSVLAAKTKSPIILADPSNRRNLPEAIARYMVESKKDNIDTSIIALGGQAVLPEEVFSLAAELGGQIKLTSFGEPVEFSISFERDFLWRLNKAFVEHEGELTLDQEQALLTAVKFTNEWLSIDYSAIDNNNFGFQYATPRFIREQKEKLASSHNLFDGRTNINRVDKLTVTGIGTYYMLQDTPYTYVRIKTETTAYNLERGSGSKRTDTYTVCLYKIRDSWEVDLVQ